MTPNKTLSSSKSDSFSFSMFTYRQCYMSLDIEMYNSTILVWYDISAVALALRRCIHLMHLDDKFAYENSEKRNGETNDAFQKHLYHPAHQTIQRNKTLFANDVRFPFTILECDHFPYVVQDMLRSIKSRFLCTLYASLPWFCVQLGFYAYYCMTQKFTLTRPLHIMLICISMSKK